MNLDDYKPVPITRFNGQVDYQGPTKVINGCAVKAQNARFDLDQVFTRYARTTTMVRQLLADITGLDVLQVLGLFNPGQVPVAFDTLGNFLLESPSGSGSLVPQAPPFTLPLNARLQTTQGNNSLFGAFSDGIHGKCPPVQLLGPTGSLAPASQNIVGARWVAGTTYIPGDLVRSVDGRWWLRDISNFAGPVQGEPQWPATNGYFKNIALAYVYSTVTDSQGGVWIEWTPNCTNCYPAPDTSSFSGLTITQGVGTITAGRDIYCRLAYETPAGSVGPWSAPFIIKNTAASSSYTIAGPNGSGLGIPRWFAELVLNPFLYSGAAAPRITLYLAAVATGSAAPADSTYELSGTVGLGQVIPVVLISNPPYNGGFLPIQLHSTQIVNGNLAVAFKGEAGTRFMTMTRKNNAGSMAPIDPNAYIQISTQGEISANIINITRDGSGNVSATVDDITDFAAGQNIQTHGATGDATFNGAFQITKVTTTLAPEGTISWVDGSHLSASNDTTGTVTLPAGPPPILFLPPGNPNFDAQDIAAFTVASPSGNTQGQAGPYFAIEQSDPSGANGDVSVAIDSLTGATNLTVNVSAINRVLGGQVQATVGNISGFVVGAPIRVAKFAGDASFNENTVIESVTPGTGSAGVIGWTSAATGASTDTTGVISTAALPGSVVAVVESTVGLAPGQTVALLGTSNADFNGQLGTIATIVQNAVTVALPVTGNATGGHMVVQPTLPTVISATIATITKITRDGAGNVVATVNLLGGFAAGQNVNVGGVADPSFSVSGLELLSAEINPDGFSGTLGWTQTGQPAATSTGGEVFSSITGATLELSLSQYAIINFEDSFLSAALDITSQLNSLPAPPFTSDASFIPSLDQVAYIDNDTYPSAFVFANQGDPCNIVGSSGDPNNPGSSFLTVSDGSTAPTVCVREMRNGEILGLKTDGGYAINPSGLLPSQWNTQRRWKKHGPVNGMAVALGKDFLAFASEEGAYLYTGGELTWISREIAKAWKRFNTSAKNTVWCEVDEDAYELKIGLPLDGATTPNYEFLCSYYAGWGEPEVLNRYGKLITPREARKWSIQPLSARTAKAVDRTLTGPRVSAGAQVWNAVSASRVGGVTTLTFPNSATMPPIHVGGLITVVCQTDPTFDITDVPVTGFNPANFTIKVGTGGANANVNNLQVYFDMLVKQVASDPRINNKQFLYGMSGSNAALGGPFQVTSLKRSAGVVTAVIQFGNYVPSASEYALIILDSCPDQSFNGEFAVASLVGNIVTWDQTGRNGTAFGGNLFTTVPQSRVTMVEPDVYADDGQGIDYQYEPFLVSASPSILTFGGCRGQIAGSGTAILTPVTEDPNFIAKPMPIVLATPVGTVIDPPPDTHYERGLHLQNEHGSVLFSNGAIAGTWFAIQDLTIYVDPRQAGRRSGN